MAIENGLFDDVFPIENGDQLLQSDLLIPHMEVTFSALKRSQKWVQTGHFDTMNLIRS